MSRSVPFLFPTSLPLPDFSRKIERTSARSVGSPISCEFPPGFRTLPILELGPCQVHCHFPCWTGVLWSFIKRRLKLAKHHAWPKKSYGCVTNVVSQSTSFEINGYLRKWAESRSTRFPILEAHFATYKFSPKVILVVFVLFSSVISVDLLWLFWFFLFSQLIN